MTWLPTGSWPILIERGGLPPRHGEERVTRPSQAGRATWLHKLAALSWADRWLLVEVFVLLGVAWLALRVVPFRRLARRLGSLHSETSTDAPPAQLAQAQRVRLAIARVAPRTPWESNCFPQALAAKFWLQRHGIPSTLYLGVALNKTDDSAPEQAPMEAHAWLRCGPLVVTGARGSERFTVVARFGESS